MREYLQRLFGVKSHDAIIDDEKDKLQSRRETVFVASDEEPDATHDNPQQITYGQAEGQTFGIIYEDAKGNETERFITVWDISPGPHSLILKARCNLRKTTRAFRVDRIQGVFDHDGEVIEVEPFLHETFGIELEHLTNFKPTPEPSQFDSFPKVRKHIKTEAVLFAGLALADGKFCEEEITIGTMRLNNLLEKQGFLLSPQGFSALSKYFRRMRPGFEEIDLALFEISQLSSERQTFFISAGLELIEADHVITEEENAMWLDFVQELTGLSLQN